MSASASLSYGAKDRYVLQIYCPFTPAKVDSVLVLMKQGMEEVAKDGVRPNELDEIKKFEQKEYTERQRNNDYWEGLITNYVMWGKDRQKGYEQTLHSITSDDIKNFLNRVVLANQNCATIIMLPASNEEKK